jgi:ABC-type branched-subunit amino acid transport system ATPase component/ABC-type branched-subunit amino acid transport system permease subunit
MTTRERLSYLAHRNIAFFIACVAYSAISLLLLQLGWVFSDVIVTAGIFFILVMSLDLAFGYTGLLSLGHVGFFAIGAYAVAVLDKQAEIPFGLATLLALVLNVALGVFLGSAFMRLRGSYFMLGTLAFGLVVQAIIRIWFSVTGGDAGLGGIPRPAVLGFELRSQLAFGALVWGIAIVLFWLAMNLTRSKVGRSLRAIRSDEVSAASAGINVGRLKTNVFALSAGYASISGSLFAGYNGAVHPESFSLNVLLDQLMMLFFGGEGTIWGGLLGATIMRVLPDVAGPLHAGKLLFSGIVFTLILFFFPQGLAGTIKLIAKKLSRPQDRETKQSVAPALLSPRAPATGDVILQVAGVVRQFGGLRAVDGVSFDVRARKIKSLIGPNGAGKTTLLNLISGALLPNAGTIRFRDRELRGERPDQIARRGIQRTFQHERLFGHLTVIENVMIGCEGGADGSLSQLVRCALAFGSTLDHERGAREEAMRWLATVGLADKADEVVSALPHGQRKLIELARAAAAGPTLLLLDETAAGLNEAEKERFKALIRQFRDGGAAVILIEHDTDFVMDLSDEIVVMNFGRKIAEGSPAAVSRDEAVLAAYLGT